MTLLRLRATLRSDYRLRLSDLNTISDLQDGEEFVAADVSDLGAMESLMQGVDGVVALGGESREHE